jgi:CheY-like chemotaxis protein
LNFSNRKILVVDDDYEIVELIKAVLRTKGHQVVVAYDGEEGLKLLTQEKPDLVITDLRMPKMSGLEFCRRIRATPGVAETPVLVISSITSGIDKPDEFWAAGLKSDDFLPKPFDPLSLLGRVEYLLRKNDYVSTARAPDGAGKSAANDVGELKQGVADDADAPDETVRSFVESWNDRNFAKEYNALGDEMLGGLSLTDYIARRAQLYADEHGDEVKHHVLDTAVKVSHNLATVACLREDMVHGIPKRKDERYTLKKSAGGWKIIGVKSRPITFTIE